MPAARVIDSFMCINLYYRPNEAESVVPAKGNPPLGGEDLTASFFAVNLNCSYECNILYGNNVPTILHQFLKLGTGSEACLACPTGCPSIALPLDAAHPFGDTQSSSISDH